MQSYLSLNPVSLALLISGIVPLLLASILLRGWRETLLRRVIFMGSFAFLSLAAIIEFTATNLIGWQVAWWAFFALTLFFAGRAFWYWLTGINPDLEEHFAWLDRIFS